MSHGQHDPVRHVNDNHADDLLVLAQTFGGHPEATSARAEHIDGEGIDVVVATPGGAVAARVTFTEPVDDGDPAGVRAAFADLTRLARAALATDLDER